MNLFTDLSKMTVFLILTLVSYVVDSVIEDRSQDRGSDWLKDRVYPLPSHMTDNATYHQEACTNFYELTCQKQTEFLQRVTGEVSAIFSRTGTIHPDFQAQNPTAAATIAAADICNNIIDECIEEEMLPWSDDRSKEEFNKTVELICLNTEKANCTEDSILTIHDFVILARAQLNTFVLNLDYNTTLDEVRLSPQLLAFADRQWSPRQNNKNKLYYDMMREEFREYLNSVLAVIQRDEKLTDDVVNFQQQLADIQFSDYELAYFVDQEDAARIDVDDDHRWPAWISFVRRTNETVQVVDVTFMYGVGDVIKRNQPTVATLALMKFVDPELTSFRHLDKVCRPKCPKDTPSIKEEIIAVNFQHADELRRLLTLDVIRQQKDLAQEIAANIRSTFIRKIESNKKLCTATKKKIIKTVHAIKSHFGIVDHFFENVWNKKLYDGVFDPNSCNMTIQPYVMDYSDVNAYANQKCRTIYVMQPMLLPPFLNIYQPTFVNYAAFGYTYAHELIHHFDSKGIHWGIDEEPENLLMPPEEQSFRDGSRCYQHDMTATCCTGSKWDRVCTEPLLNQDEDIADLVGLDLACDAYIEHALIKDVERIYGDNTFENRQKISRAFFHASASFECLEYPNHMRYFHHVNSEHSPMSCRLLRQYPEFTKAFGCDARNDFMARPDWERCEMWQ